MGSQFEFSVSGIELIKSSFHELGSNGLIVFKNVNAEGIPITPDWLLKLGFTYKDGWDDVYVNDRLRLYGNPFKAGWTVENIEPNFELHYIHQLQNLYFSLTGKELTRAVGENYYKKNKNF